MMNARSRILMLSGAIASLFVTIPAAAITYTGSRDIGKSHVDLSITTDGAIGVLQQSSFLDWRVTVTDPNSTASFFSQRVANEPRSVNIGLILHGSALTATSTSLSFDFGLQTGPAFLHFGPNYRSGTVGYQLVADFGPDFPPTEYASVSLDSLQFEQARAGIQVIATAGSVPEPASWAMMLIGFGGIGIASRRTRHVAA